MKAFGFHKLCDSGFFFGLIFLDEQNNLYSQSYNNLMQVCQLQQT